MTNALTSSFRHSSAAINFTLKEAASLLGVSEMTIRRDLNGHSGPVVLLGGYIVLEPRSATHYLLSDQKTRLVDENAVPRAMPPGCLKRIRWPF